MNKEEAIKRLETDLFCAIEDAIQRELTEEDIDNMFQQVKQDLMEAYEL
jgi:hypothetical protein